MAAKAESPCNHEHTADCYAEELTCGHEFSAETGCVTEVLNCQHKHDADCGYAPAVAGSPCTHQHDASCGGLVTEEQPITVEKLQERIDDLPDADALADMAEEELQEVSDEIGEIMDAIEEIGKDGLKLDGLYALQAAFLALAAAVPAPLAEDEESLPEGTLDIGESSILITNTGYTQGTLKFENTKGFSILDAAGNEIEETLWSDGKHALTIVGSSIGVNEATSISTIVIAGGTPTGGSHSEKQRRRRHQYSCHRATERRKQCE